MRSNFKLDLSVDNLSASTMDGRVGNESAQHDAVGQTATDTHAPSKASTAAATHQASRSRSFRHSKHTTFVAHDQVSIYLCGAFYGVRRSST